MIAKLEFNLDEPGDREAHDVAVKASSWRLVAWDMDQWLRGKIKHSNESPDAQAVRDTLHQILSDNGVSFD